MDIIKKKYPFWKRLLHKWQSRRDIPFRKNSSLVMIYMVIHIGNSLLMGICQDYDVN